MSAPYPPAPRKLTRSTTNRMIGGVCGGLAEYLNMDATLVRILTVLISLFTGVPVVLYIIALFVIPEADAAPRPPAYPPVTGTQNAPTYPTTTTAPAEPAYAPYPETSTPTPTPQRTSADDAIWGTEGPPWEQREPEPTPPPPAADSAPAAEPEAPAEPVAPSEPEAPVAPADKPDETPKI